MIASAQFTIRNKLGMHARAAAIFVELARSFRSRIRVRKGNQEASAASIMGVLQLGAVQGEVIEVVAEGEDAAEALAALGRLVGDRFQEGE